MIYIGKSPYRVSLLGGSSDLNWFLNQKNYGVCLGYSLNQYSYSVLNILPSYSQKGILEYSAREEYKNINEIVHPIVREVLLHFDISNFIELKTFGFATGGSGLGGSASFLLSLISSISKAFEMNIPKKDLIEKACFLEINKLKKPIGKQDQYLCANKGFSSFTFFSNNTVRENPISMQKKKTLERLSNDFYLIPTFKKRKSDSVLKKIIKDDESLDKIMKIRKIAEKFISFDDERDYKIQELFHNSIKESWLIKKSLAEVMTSILTEQYEFIDQTIPNDWIRLIGAGSGGYFLISSKVDQDTINSLSSKNGIKGIFKASLSNEEVSSFAV